MGRTLCLLRPNELKGQLKVWPYELVTIIWAFSCVDRSIRDICSGPYSHLCRNDGWYLTGHRETTVTVENHNNVLSQWCRGVSLMPRFVVGLANSAKCGEACPEEIAYGSIDKSGQQVPLTVRVMRNGDIGVVGSSRLLYGFPILFSLSFSIRKSSDTNL